MTGSVNALLKYMLLSITLVMLGFSVGCNGEKKQQKKSNNGGQTINDKDSLDAKKENSDDLKKKNEDEDNEDEDNDNDDEDNDNDNDDEDNDDEDEESNKPGTKPGSNSDLIKQVTALLSGGGAGGLDITTLTALLGAGGGGAGGLPLDKIKALLGQGGAGGLDPAALSGLLKGLDQKQLQDLLSKLKP